MTKQIRCWWTLTKSASSNLRPWQPIRIQTFLCVSAGNCRRKSCPTMSSSWGCGVYRPQLWEHTHSIWPGNWYITRLIRFRRLHLGACSFWSLYFFGTRAIHPVAGQRSESKPDQRRHVPCWTTFQLALRPNWQCWWYSNPFGWVIIYSFQAILISVQNRFNTRIGKL